MLGRKRAAMLGGLLAIGSVVGCGAAVTDPLRPTGAGTVRHQSLEGGFYAIVADDGRRFDPLNLPQNLQQEGLRVRFSGRVRTDVGSIHMWGEILELEQIAPE